MTLATRRCGSFRLNLMTSKITIGALLNAQGANTNGSRLLNIGSAIEFLDISRGATTFKNGGSMKAPYILGIVAGLLLPNSRDGAGFITALP